MTLKANSRAVALSSAMFLTACETGTPSETIAAVGGKTLVQIQDQYPEISAAAFSALDDNRDGVIDATEETDIGRRQRNTPDS